MYTSRARIFSFTTALYPSRVLPTLAGIFVPAFVRKAGTEVAIARECEKRVSRFCHTLTNNRNSDAISSRPLLKSVITAAKFRGGAEEKKRKGRKKKEKGEFYGE